jgi:hypothetical protein
VFLDMTAEAENTICSAQAWPEAAVDYLFSINHGRYVVPEYYEITRDQLSDYFRSKARSLASVASALPELFMKRHGKARWIEKTPGHIMCTDKIRELFPTAPIIQIRRDPRDVSLSLLNVPWGPGTFLEALIYCYAHHSNDDFFNRDHNSCTVRYEDLLSSPESELQKVCDLLDEPFEPSMLDTKQAAALIDSGNDSWMKKAGEHIDKSRAHAWRRILTAEQKRQADALIGGDTDEADALSQTLPSFIEVKGFATTTDHPGLALLSRIIQESNVRFWPVSADERSIGTLFIGDPGSGEWLGHGNRWQRLRNALAISAKIVKYRICGHPYAWPWLASADWSSLGYSSKLITIALGRKRDLVIRDLRDHSSRCSEAS